MSKIERFEHYEVLRREDGTLHELGRGAMGVTYKAWDTDLHCQVALKVVHPGLLDSGDARERFMREARAAAKLHHPNIATVFRLGKADDDTHFYAMELCEGPTLQQAVAERGSFDARLAVEVAFQVSKALVVGENQHVVHRDLKPSNIILTQRAGEGLVVKVIDFGVAKCLAVPGQSMATATTGGFVGTAQFASPEQLEEHEVDIRSDIYSLGVCIWFMLTGRPVFDGSMARVMAQTLSAEPAWDQLAGQLPSLVALLKRLLAKDPDLRPIGAVALREDLDACARQLSDAKRPRPQAILGGILPKPSPTTPCPAPIDQQKPAPQVPQRDPTTTPPTASGLLLNRYQWVNEIARDGLGTLGMGWDRMNGRARVMLRLFDPGTLNVPAVRRVVERRIEALRLYPHPALPTMLDFAEHLGEWVLATDLQDDARGVDLMKARGALPLSEALALIAPVAAALDHGESKKLELPSLALHRLVIAFHSSPPKVADVLRRPISEWSSFAVKLDAPVFEDTAAADDGATMSSMRTLIAPVNSASVGVNGGGASSVARVIYELMGGTPRSTGYTPLARLSEAGNTVLRRAIDGDFESAVDIIETLKKHIGYEAQPSAARPAMRIVPPTARSPKPWIKFAWIGTGVAVLIGSGLFYHFGIQEPRERQREERAANAEKERRKMQDQADKARQELDQLKAAAEEAKAKELAKAKAAAEAESAKKEKERLQVAQPQPALPPRPSSPVLTPVTSTSPPAATTAVAKTGEQGVRAFIENMQILEDLHDMNAIIAQYAPLVDYYDERQATHEFVRKDKEKYFATWPKTTNKVQGAIDVKTPGNGLYVATYTNEFGAENPYSGTWIAGEAKRQLIIREERGRFLIAQEKAEVTRKSQGNSASLLTTDPAIDKFVRGAVEMKSLKSLDDIMTHYADNVDYYNNGLANKNFIHLDKMTYFLKWRDPHTIIGPIQVTPLKDGLSRAEFVTSYHAENTEGKPVQGTCKHWLVLEKLDDELFIVEEKNEVHNALPDGSNRIATGNKTPGTKTRPRSPSLPKQKPPTATRPSNPVPKNAENDFRERTKKFDKF